MFIFLVFCPPPHNLAWRQFYADLFTNFPPRYILQTLADLSKVNPGGSKNNNIPFDLLTKVDKYFHLEFDKIDLVMDIKATKKAQHKIVKSKFEDCTSGNNCSYQRGIDLG